MTERLYYKEPGLFEFAASIVSSDPQEGKFVTLLDRSAFYPTSGGQFHDTGRLNNVEIVEVYENEEGDVCHVSLESVGKVGEDITGFINSERRNRFRQLHTAQHIISRVFIELCEAETVSVHLGTDYGAVELDVSSLEKLELQKAEARVNELIQTAMPVDILFVTKTEAEKLPLRKFPDREGEFRIIKIGEYEYSACGGTHCNNSAELRFLKIIGVEKIRSRLLVKFLVGQMAIDDYLARHEITESLSKSLTCHWSDLPQNVENILLNQKELMKKVTALQKELLPIQAEEISREKELINNVPLVMKAFPGLEPKAATILGGHIAEKIDGVVMLVVDSTILLTTSPDYKLKAGELARKLTVKLNLRGGGSATAAQIGGAAIEKFDHYCQELTNLIQGN